MRGVVASETRAAQTGSAEWSADLCGHGVVRLAGGCGGDPHRVTNHDVRRTPLERAAGAGESPVGRNVVARCQCVSTAEHVKFRGKPGRPRSKAKHPAGPIAQSTARER
jgi:hypothetical protein